MDALREDSRDIKLIQKRRVILILSLIFFSFWLAANILVLVIERYYIVTADSLFNFMPTVCSVFYVLFLFCFAQYMQSLNFKREQVVTYIIVAITIIVSSLLFAYIYIFSNEGYNYNNIESFLKIYSVLTSVFGSINNVLMLSLGIMLILRSKSHPKGVIIAGIAFILNFLISIFSSTVQTVISLLNMHYGISNYKSTILITSILYLTGFIILGLGVICFFVKTNNVLSKPISENSYSKS